MNLTKLKELAQKTIQGPWFVKRSRHYISIQTRDGSKYKVICTSTSSPIEKKSPQTEINYEYLSMCEPKNIISMIEEIEMWRSKND